MTTIDENQGWVKIFRKFRNWEWYSDTVTFRVFFHLLLTANYETKRWHGIEIRRGQIFTSYQHIIDEIGDTRYTKQNIRTAINHLKSTGELTVLSTHGGMLITIEKYDLYQLQNEKITRKSTDLLTFNQQTTNTNIRRIRRIRNKRSMKKNIEKNKNAFELYEELIAPLTSSSAEILNDYIDNLSEELVQLAIKKADENNKRSLSYLKGILNSWIKKGIKTIEQVKQEEKQFKNRTQNKVTTFDKELPAEELNNLYEN